MALTIVLVTGPVAMVPGARGIVSVAAGEGDFLSQAFLAPILFSFRREGE